MKKQTIIIILIIIVVLIIAGGCAFFFKGKSSKQNNNFNPQAQNQNVVSISALAVGNWVSVMAEKSGDSYTASMIIACTDKASCQTGGSGQTNRQRPSGTTAQSSQAPTGNTQRTGNTANRTMLSGTITAVGTDSISLNLDAGGTATVSVPDSARIIKR